jgi:hypothetical protein
MHTPRQEQQSKAKQNSSEFTDNNNLQRTLSKVSFFTVKSLKMQNSENCSKIISRISTTLCGTKL